MERVTPDNAALSRAYIADLLSSHVEWFHFGTDGDFLPLRRNEIEITVAQGRLILSCWTDKGTRSWRISSWLWTGAKLVFQASRRMGSEKRVLELVPRPTASAITATIKAARQGRCEQLGQLACALLPGSKVERAQLSPGIRRGQPGRYARILLRLKHERVAVTASVGSHKASDVDSLISAALLWFTRTSERSRPPYIRQLWIVLEGELVKAAVPRLLLLRSSLKEVIRPLEIDHDWGVLRHLEIPSSDSLWKKRLARFPPVVEPEISNSARLIRSEEPEAIDIVQTRNGETLRYRGLPFARVRRVLGNELVWFGTDGSRRRLLEENSADDWSNLMKDLQQHRSATAEDHRHALYRNASEAWLESILRRDISKLDPGLIIAPLHAQFRTSPGGRFGVRPIDLLALRRDGRLVVIELKVAEDREHVLQGVGYWQRVEAHRRRGHIARAKLFGERSIANQSPLVYLVAPTLRVHPAFSKLTSFISSEIEIYRFDINEDWRAGVRVMRRMRAN